MLEQKSKSLPCEVVEEKFIGDDEELRSRLLYFPFIREVAIAERNTKKLLAEPRGQEALRLLPSIRLVGRVFNDYHAAIQRPNDVLFIEESLYGRQMPVEEVHGAYSVIQQLAAEYYPLAERMAQKQLLYHDADFAIDYAQSEVERAVWKSWKPKDVDPDVQGSELGKYMYVTLTRLWQSVKRTRQDDALETPYGSAGDDDETELRPEVVKQILENDTTVRDTQKRKPHVRTIVRDGIQEIIRDMPIAEVFAKLELLNKRSQLVLLQLLGWYSDQRSVEEFYDTLPMGAYLGDLKRAAKEFVLLTRDNKAREKTAPERTVAEIVHNLDHTFIFRSRDAILMPSSARRIVAEGFYDAGDAITQKLNEQQKQVFALCVVHTNGLLTYGNAAIAQQLQLPLETVNREVGRIARICKGASPEEAATLGVRKPKRNESVATGRSVMFTATEVQMVKTAADAITDLSGFSDREREVIRFVSEFTDTQSSRGKKSIARQAKERFGISEKRFYQIMRGQVPAKLRQRKSSGEIFRV